MAGVGGTVDPRFAAIADRLGALTDKGAAVAVVVDGQVVADLWAGHADAGRTKGWTGGTLVNIWSCTKALVAIAAGQAVDRGQLDWDDPIARNWPEFGQNGKAGITLAQVMTHVSGLNGFATPQPDDLFLHWPDTIRALEQMAPNHPPGQQPVYHALTYGHLVAEVLSRVTGRTIRDIIAQDIAGPLGADIHLGLPADQTAHGAEMVAGPGTTDWVDFALGSPFPQAVRHPRPDPLAPNSAAWRAAAVTGANGHAGALSLARVMGDLARLSPHLMSATTRDRMIAERVRAVDAGFGDMVVWSCGLRLDDPNSYGLRAGARSFGHGGWGGSMVMADPDRAMGFAFVTNHMMGFADGIDPRRRALVDAVYDAL
jgi:CubicO group peptidase (beta-lactamase class C family)